MGVFEQFPYTNFHDINLDWVLREVEKVRADMDALETNMADFAEELRGDFTSFTDNIDEQLDDINGRIADINDTIDHLESFGIAAICENTVYALGIMPMPPVTTADDGQVWAVVGGEWQKTAIPNGNLPPVSGADEGKMLSVENGEWGLGSFWGLERSINLFKETAITLGKFMSKSGAVQNNSTYFYTEHIPCTPGETFYFKTRYNTDGYYVVRTYMGRVTAFDADGNVAAAAGSDTAVYSYEVPTGIYSVVFSGTASIYTDGKGMVVKSEDVYAYQPYFAPYRIVNTRNMPTDYETLEHGIWGYPPEKGGLATFQNGNSIILGNCSARKSRIINFRATVDTMGQFTIWNGDSDGSYFHSKVIITDTTVTTYACALSGYIQVFTAQHGLAINDYINVALIQDKHGATSIRIDTNGSYYENADIKFTGRGVIQVTSEGASFTDAIFNWSDPDIKSPIWIFGDSYTQLTSTKYWPRHIVDSGYVDFSLVGWPGAKSKDVYPYWKAMLRLGKPRYVVWTLGLNDADTSSDVNSEWYRTYKMIVEDCQTYGIVPILATIPNVPARINTYKNSIVRSSGCRYIDFAAAVGANSAGSDWYAGMLDADETHPTTQGAIALEKQVLADFPEITL